MQPVVASVAKMLARAGPILKRLPIRDPSMVEIGVSSGLMAEHLLKTRPDLQWYGVDPWRGPEEHPAAYRATGDTHAFLSKDDTELQMALALTRVSPFGDRAIVSRMASADAAKMFVQECVDTVFLDGDHSYEGTLLDCISWWPIVKSGGFLGGHDYAHKNV